MATALAVLSGCDSNTNNTISSNTKTTTATVVKKPQHRTTATPHPGVPSADDTASTTPSTASPITDRPSTVTYNAEADLPRHSIIYGRISRADNAPLINAKMELKKIRMESVSEGKIQSTLYATVSLSADGKYKIPVNKDATDYITLSGDNISTASGMLFPNQYKKVKSESSVYQYEYEFSKVVAAITEVSGRVEDHDGNPIANTPVHFIPIQTSMEDLMYEDIITTTTADGSFHLKNLPSVKGDFAATPPGFSTAITENIYIPTSDSIVIKATRKGGSIAGTVINSDTLKPVEGVHLFASFSVQPNQAPPARSLLRMTKKSARSDSSGKFIIENLYPGTYNINVTQTPDGLISHLDNRNNSQSCIVKENDATPIEVKVSNGYTIHGKVFDSETNQPLPGAQIKFNLGAFKELKTTSAADGTYNTTGIGEYANPSVELEGYIIPKSLSTIRASDYPNKDIHLDFPMIQALKISGRVQLEDGTPVLGAIVASEAKYPTANPQPAKADKDGTYTLLTTPYSRHTLTAVHKDYVTSDPVTIETTTDDLRDINIVMVPEIKLAGKVVDSDGKAIKDVLVRNDYPDKSIETNLQESSKLLNNNGNNDIRTGMAGDFQINRVRSNSKLTLYHNDYITTSYSVSNYQLKLGEPKSDLVLIMEKGYKISGTVRNQEGEIPKSSVSISSVDKNGERRGELSYPTPGNFVISELRKDKYTLKPYSGNDFTPIEVEGGTTGVKIIINEIKPTPTPTPKPTKYVTLNGKIIDETTKLPVKNFKGDILCRNFSPKVKTSNSSEFTIEKLQAGDGYRLKIKAEGFAEKDFNFTVPTDQDEFDMEFPLNIGYAVRGVILDKATDKPIEKVLVEFNLGSQGNFITDFKPHGPQSENYTLTDANGTFELHGISSDKGYIIVRPAAPYKLQEIPFNQMHQPHTQLYLGKVTDLGKIYLADGGSIYGTFTDGYDKPIKGAKISIVKSMPTSRAGTKTIETETNAQGEYQFLSLEDGYYYLECKNPATSARISLSNSEDKEVNLTVK